jgi:hypothetical protein
LWVEDEAVRPVGIVIVLGLLGLGSCGGSTSSTTTSTSPSSAERTRLESELRSSLEAPTSELASARDLDDCVVQQASRLPLASLRKLVTAETDRPVADPLLARCVAQGKGLTWIRGTIATEAAGKLPPSTPPAFTRCMIAGVDALTPAKLAAALQNGASGDQTYSVRLGQRIALQCIQQPGLFEQYRKVLVSGIRQTLQGRHLPTAFVQCVLNKANRISPAQLTTLVQGGPGVQNAYGEKLGRACRAAPSA